MTVDKRAESEKNIERYDAIREMMTSDLKDNDENETKLECEAAESLVSDLWSVVALKDYYFYIRDN